MKVENDVLAVLARASTDGNALTLVGHLDRKLYVRTNAVLEAGGGKWDKKAKAHIFEGGAAESMEQIIMTGEVTLARTIQQDYGYFPTPDAVVGQLMDHAELSAGHLVLEPSAGRGNIAFALAPWVDSVIAMELLEANVDALARDKPSNVVLHGPIDFLSVTPESFTPFDRVVMNPPFAKQADIHHVNHALKFLKPGGRLVSVMSASVIYRDNKLTTDFRDMVRERGGFIEELGEGAFKSSGTMVRTVIVVIPA